MKKLICAKDVEEMNTKGEIVIGIDKDTIITPSAKDAAESLGMKFTEIKPDVMEDVLPAGLDSNKIYKVLKVLLEKGVPESLFRPFEAQSHANGLKIVRGNTVRMDVFDTGKAGTKVFYQELVNKEESRINAGFLTIESSSFEWELTYEEFDYVIEGTVTVTIDQKTYTGHAGDVLYIPAGSKVIWGTPDKVKMFYITGPEIQGN